MRTIPAATAGMLIGDQLELRQVAQACGRLVGARVEVDLDALEAKHPALARALDTYHRHTSALWRDLALGRAHTRQPVVTTRTLEVHQQVTGKVGRADLDEVYLVLRDLPQTAALLKELTRPAPRHEQVAELVELADGSVDVDADGVWTVSIPLPGAVAWPRVLGGPAHLHELSRTMTVVVRHANWRQKLVHRLARVQVDIVELWADPADARALLKG